MTSTYQETGDLGNRPGGKEKENLCYLGYLEGGPGL